MGKKQKKVSQQKQYVSHKDTVSNQLGNDLKSLLDEDVLKQLKEAAETMKQDEQKAKQKKADELAAAQKAEQKRLENDFAYLLEHSDQQGHKYK